MRAAQVLRLDGPDGMEVGEVDEPIAREGQVLIDVEAAGVTFPDLLMTRGEYQMKPNPPFVPGSQVAGTVRSAPEGSGLQPGDRVAALCGLGGFAEVATAGPDATFPLPDGVSFAAGAVLPVNYLTAEFAFERRGRLQPGETVLVHGAAGGVGTASIQVAKAMGARVIAVVSTDAKGEVARRLGADEVVSTDGFKDAARELTDGKGVDVVLDPVGGDRFTDSLRSLATEGRLLVVGFAGGEIPTVKVNRLLLANTSVVGVAWGEYAFSHPGYLQEQWARLVPHLASGAVDPLVGGTYPLAEAAVAVGELAARRATGTLVIEPGADGHPMTVAVRPERPADAAAVATVVETAFDDAGLARLVAELRDEPSYRVSRSLVAVDDDRVVGFVMVTDSTLRPPDGAAVDRIATLSPLAVAPDRQGEGIGTALVSAVLAACDAEGEPAVVLEGDPGYYRRLGFEPAGLHGLVLPLPDWASAEAAQVHRLGAWAGLSGAVAYSPPFDRLPH